MCAGCKYVWIYTLFFVGGTVFWEGRVRDLCVQRKHLFTTVESEGILISITYTLFYPPLLWVPCIRNSGLCFSYLPFIIGVYSWKEKRTRKTYLENELAEMSANMAEQPKKGRILLSRRKTVLFNLYCMERRIYLALYFTSIWQRKLVLSGNENRYSFYLSPQSVLCNNCLLFLFNALLGAW